MTGRWRKEASELLHIFLLLMVSVLGFAFFRKFRLEFGAITSSDAGNDGVDLIGIKLAHVLHIA